MLNLHRSPIQNPSHILTVMPQEAARYTWDWGDDFAFILLSGLFRIQITVFSDAIFRYEEDQFVGQVFDSYYHSSLPPRDRNRVLNHYLEKVSSHAERKRIMKKVEAGMKGRNRKYVLFLNPF